MTSITPATVPAKGNPFVGPRAFMAGESLFGRRREVSELFGLLVSERIVLLHSPPRARASRRSSRAGLIPGSSPGDSPSCPVSRKRSPPSGAAGRLATCR